MRFSPRALAGRAFSVLLSSSAAILFAACEAGGTTADEKNTAPYDDATVIEALSLGARGEAVTKLQSYLMQYGYFPNDALAAQFPEWVPVIDKTPEAGVFDATTEAAVRALQSRNELEATGIADPATRALMAMGRCANPDSFQADPDSKFAYMVRRWKADKHSFTWKVYEPSACMKWNASSSRWVACFDGSHPAPATRDQIRTVVQNVFGQWARESDLTFTEKKAGESAEIIFQFSEFAERSAHMEYAIRGPADALAGTSPSLTTQGEIYFARVDFNQAKFISSADTTPADAFDMTAIALHEVGHALGLDHSSSLSGTEPVMKSGTARGPGALRLLAADDSAAISARYNLWNSHPGLAVDIGIGANGAVWHVGTQALGDGYRIYKWNAGMLRWDEASGGGGGWKISVGPDGTPLLTTKGGSVWWHSPNVNEGGWNNIAGLCAKDVSVGANGSIWFVTCTEDPGPDGGYKVGKLIVVAISPDTVAIGIQEGVGATHATRIAVAPEGTPWIINTAGDVWYRVSQDPNVAGWGLRGGIKALDIAISPDYFTYAVSLNGNSGKLWIRNDQAEISSMVGGNKVVEAPERHEWDPLAALPSGSGVTLAAGRRSVWAVNNSLNMFESTAK